MLDLKTQINDKDKKYYILDTSLKIFPLNKFKFNKTTANLETLVKSTCLKGTESNNQNTELKTLIRDMGFNWEPLSEPGQMKLLPYAITITEVLEKYSWVLAEQFARSQNFSIYKIGGGEVFDPAKKELKKQMSIISESQSLYGSNYYYVIIKKKRYILRYSSCIQKLSIAGGLNLKQANLPFGLFEISKSYRYEIESELNLCSRTRNFHLPELHVLTENISSALKTAYAAHLEMLKEIRKLNSDYQLFCSVTNDFFLKNKDFLRGIIKTINKPMLLAIYNEGIYCKDGVKIDIEYKVIDGSGLPVEFSTFQVDDGSTNSAYDVIYKSNKGNKKPISTVHVVFNSSLERFTYLILDKAVREKTETKRKHLPFWFSPIQVRIITYDKSSQKSAEKLLKKLSFLNLRVDVDDREIDYSTKMKEKSLEWIPYVITVNKNLGLNRLKLISNTQSVVEKIISTNRLLKDIRTQQKQNVIVPRYSPAFLSGKIF